MCFGCYDGYTFSLDWRDNSDLAIADHELDILKVNMNEITCESGVRILYDKCG